MENELVALKARINTLTEERNKLQNQLSKLKSVTNDVTSVKNTQLQKSKKLKDSVKNAYSAIGTTDLLDDAGDFIKDHVLDRHLRDQALSFKNCINDIIRYNTSLATKIDSLKKV